MKKNILFLIIGMIIASGISVVAYQMNATQVTYEPKDKSWKVNTVKGAIDDIKENGTTKKIAKVISGDKNTVGSVVKIGDEEFYVIGQGSGDTFGLTKLLTKYSLSNNNQVSSYGPGLKFSETDYWTSRGLSTSSNPKPYVYDDNSNLYLVVNNYVNKIKNIGASYVSGRLMTYEEANSLSTNIRKAAGTDYYWIGSLGSNNYLLRVNNQGGIIGGDSGCRDGIRPVILIPTDEIK